MCSLDWPDHTATDGDVFCVRLSSVFGYPASDILFADIAFFGSATFIIFACACFGAYLWSSYVVPETAGVSLEEMDAVFGSTAGQEDRKWTIEV
jgi:hypothetical protein